MHSLAGAPRPRASLRPRRAARPRLARGGGGGHSGGGHARGARARDLVKLRRHAGWQGRAAGCGGDNPRQRRVALPGKDHGSGGGGGGGPTRGVRGRGGGGSGGGGGGCGGGGGGGRGGRSGRAFAEAGRIEARSRAQHRRSDRGTKCTCGNAGAGHVARGAGGGGGVARRAGREARGVGARGAWHGVPVAGCRVPCADCVAQSAGVPYRAHLRLARAAAGRDSVARPAALPPPPRPWTRRRHPQFRPRRPHCRLRQPPANLR